MGVRRNAAVYAGIPGALALVAPVPAAALSLRDVTLALDGLFSSPSAAFAAGLAGGALAMGVVAGTVALVSRHRRRAREAEPARPEDTVTDQPALSLGSLPVVEASAPMPRHLRVDAVLFDDDAEAPAIAPSHAANDYEEIAENYVGRATFREKMARRAGGVAATLRDRLGGNMMDGVPVIERADGSVGDVGTSWWKQAVGEQSIISDSGFAPEDAGLAIPSDFTTANNLLLEPSPAPAAAPGRGAGISRRIANIDEGAYPERRTIDDIGGFDEWDLALRSLDERLALEDAGQAPAPFVDMVGGADTLDEPDNLEPQTSFIPFKTPAGHPEVVDTETYVDYLIEDEFSKSSSPAARRSSSRFLRVLEGGTQPPSRHLSDTSTIRTSHAGKHFASPMVAEA